MIHLRSDKPLSLTIAFAWSMMVEQSTYTHKRDQTVKKVAGLGCVCVGGGSLISCMHIHVHVYRGSAVIAYSGASQIRTHTH